MGVTYRELCRCDTGWDRGTYYIITNFSNITYSYMYIYMYVNIHTYVCVCACIYSFRQEMSPSYFLGKKPLKLDKGYALKLREAIEMEGIC